MVTIRVNPVVTSVPQLNSMSLAASHTQLIGIPAVPAVGRLIGKELTLEAKVLHGQSLALSLGVR